MENILDGKSDQNSKVHKITFCIVYIFAQTYYYTKSLPKDW